MVGLEDVGRNLLDRCCRDVVFLFVLHDPFCDALYDVELHDCGTGFQHSLTNACASIAFW